MKITFNDKEILVIGGKNGNNLLRHKQPSRWKREYEIEKMSGQEKLI